MLKYLNDVCQVDSGLHVCLLDYAKATVRRKFGVASNKEENVHFVMKLVSNPPGNVPEHEVVFVLSAAVVTMKVHDCFSNSKVAEEMMLVADDFIAALT